MKLIDPRTWKSIALLTALVVLLASTVRYVRYAMLVCPLWYGEYGEGIVWQQALLIPGGRMYGDISSYPFIVFHYPPLYHLVIRAVSFFGPDMLIAGRGVSIVATIGVSILVAAFTYQRARCNDRVMGNLLIAFIAALTVFSHQSVAHWSVVMRVDMLGLAFAFAGALLIVYSPRHPSLVYPAMISFILAIYTKQTLVAAPVASLGILLWVEPRLAWKGIAFGLCVGLLVFGYLEWSTNGRFIEHIVLYNINPSDFTSGIYLISEQMREIIYLLLALVSMVTGLLSLYVEQRRRGWDCLRKRLIRDASAFTHTIFSLYFLLCLAMLTMVFKQGASDNYFIESMCVSSVMIGLLLVNLLNRLALFDQTKAQKFSAATFYVTLALVVVQVLMVRLPPSRTLTSAAMARTMGELLEMVRAASKPVLSDDMVTLLRANKEVPLEPAIFSSLARVGLWDQRPLIDLIRSHHFAFIVTQNGDRIFRARYTEPVREAISSAYPNKLLLNTLYTIHMP